MKPSKTLIIEYAEKSLKLCSVSRLREKTVIDDSCLIELPQNPSKEFFREKLGQFLTKHHRQAVVLLSRSLFFMRYLDIPSLRTEEISDMLSFQLAKVYPSSLKETIYDYSCIGTQDGISRLLVYLVQEQKIALLFEALNEKNIRLPLVGITSEALKKLVYGCASELNLSFSAPVAIIDIDTCFAEIAVVNKSGLLFSRAFSYKEDRDIRQDIEQSLRSYEKQSGNALFERVVFTGIRKEALLNMKVGGKVVFLDEYRNSLIANEIQEYITGKNYSIAALCGQALSPLRSTFDFSPLSVRQARRRRQSRQRKKDMATILLQLFFIGLVFFTFFLLDAASYDDFLDRKLAQVKARLDDPEHILKVLSVAREKSAAVSFSEILYHVLSGLPPESRVALIDIRVNGEFLMKGYVMSVSDAFATVTLLNDGKIMKQANLKYAVETEEGGKKMIEFLILGEVAKGDEKAQAE